MTDTIPSRQNTTENLRLLAAQKAMYSQAKHVFWWRSALTVPLIIVVTLGVRFFGSSWSPMVIDLSWLPALVGAAITLTDILLLSRWESRLQSLGARTQEMFDTDVLKLPWNIVSVGPPVTPEAIRDYAARTQAKPGATDNLPDWYPMTLQRLPDEVARLLCQRFNLHWDSDLRSRFSLILLIVGLALLAVLFVIGVIAGLTVSSFVFAVLLPFIPFLHFALRQHQSNKEAVKNLDGLREHIERLWQDIKAGNASTSLSEESRRIQDRIYTNRKTSPLILDRLYFRSRPRQEKSMIETAEGFVEEYFKGRSTAT